MDEKGILNKDRVLLDTEENKCSKVYVSFSYFFQIIPLHELFSVIVHLSLYILSS